jgi:hypothetical protein
MSRAQVLVVSDGAAVAVQVGAEYGGELGSPYRNERSFQTELIVNSPLLERALIREFRTK